MDTLAEDIVDAELNEKLDSCKHFLVDSLSLKSVANVFLTALCHPSTTFTSMKRNHIMCTSNSKKQPKSTLHPDLFWKALNIERVNTLMHTKTIRLRRALISCATEALTNLRGILQKMDVVHPFTRKEVTLKGDFLKIQTSQSVIHFSMIYKWLQRC